jgi:hypothetical protein
VVSAECSSLLLLETCRRLGVKGEELNASLVAPSISHIFHREYPPSSSPLVSSARIALSGFVSAESSLSNDR